MKKTFLVILTSALMTSCSNIYIVRPKSISRINSEISRDKEQIYVKRVIVTGWAIDGFECTAIFETKDDLINRRYAKSLWVEGGFPFGITDPYDEGYIYKIAKVRIEGTVRHYPRYHSEVIPEYIRGAGHMGLWNASLIDNIITVESKVETLNTKKEPNQSLETTTMAVTPAAVMSDLKRKNK